MLRALTIGVMFGSAVLFGCIPIVRLYDAFQPLIVALSIMVAAIFVRLNRGMPTLDWNSIDPAERAKLTTRIVELSLEYVWIVAVDATGLAAFISLTVVGKADIQAGWSAWAQRGMASAIGAMLALSVTRMGYVVWRDYDIVRLQKHIIDASAIRAAADREAKSSTERIANIRSAGLRNITGPEPKAWGE